MDKSLFYLLLDSWKNKIGSINSTESILEWIENRNREVHIELEMKQFGSDNEWLYKEEDMGIVHKSGCFFSIKGIVKTENGKKVFEQPIIIQDEIGYLGIICKKINGVLNFLMQAKVEPGNVNKVQISPTIQATKSNFMQVHGGRKPSYLEYFINKSRYDVIVDQIQSEHSSYFLGKRNRNIIINVDEEIEVSPNHKWMTLGQIKELMTCDNLVNMDTRTVISCIPFNFEVLDQEEMERVEPLIENKALWRSMICTDMNAITRAYQYLNDFKMMDFSQVNLVNLKSLDNWKFNENCTEFFCEKKSDFKIIYSNIEIEGREIRYWRQPLIEALNMKLIGLFRCIDNGVMKYLVCAVSEIGCFDKIELGPTVCIDQNEENLDDVERLFVEKYNKNKKVIVDRLYSEEGGRFYHGQNRNIIIEISKKEVNISKTSKYMWMDFHSLNKLIQTNNYLNIYLRNLVSLQEL